MLEKIKNLFLKKAESKKEKSSEVDEQLEIHSSETAKKSKENVTGANLWYSDRYDKIIVQRNLIFVLLVISITFSIVASGVIGYVVNLRSFEPFVIQVDDATGRAQIVNPVSDKILSGNDALSEYFIKKYIISRETYNPVDFTTHARKTVRLFSAGNVYRAFRSYISDERIDPTLIYGQKNTTYLNIKSWSKLAHNKYVVRFSVHETDGRKKVFHKIAIVEYRYVAMELTEKDREVNPVGFQVTGYRVDDDNS